MRCWWSLVRAPFANIVNSLASGPPPPPLKAASAMRQVRCGRTHRHMEDLDVSSPLVTSGSRAFDSTGFVGRLAEQHGQACPWLGHMSKCITGALYKHWATETHTCP